MKKKIEAINAYLIKNNKGEGGLGQSHKQSGGLGGIQWVYNERERERERERGGGEREREGETERQTDRQRQTVSWCFTPSQPVRLYQGDETDRQTDTERN